VDEWHRRCAEWQPHVRRFVEVLARERPDCILCTHQRASQAVPAMLAARKLGIPSATFIYSWDNLPKGRMAVHADHFLVWSEDMRAELRRYYPEVTPDRIHVIGTPQFEFYFDGRFRQSREAFLQSLGLDAARPVICFSGDDVATSPFDPCYLGDVARALDQFSPASRPQLLFRPCPTDGARRYRWVLEQHPQVILSPPLWTRLADGDWTQVVPARDDVALLVNIATHCDLVVNLGSTMALDFAINGNPAIFLNYNPQGVPPGSTWNARDKYRLPHFRLIHESNPVYWAHSAEDLPTLIDHALRNRAEKAAARAVCVRRVAAHPLDEATQRCVQALHKIAAARLDQCTSGS